jgi:hypothetical protein
MDINSGLTNDHAIKTLLSETDNLLETHAKSLSIPSYFSALRKPEFILCIVGALLLILPALLSVPGYIYSPINRVVS